MKTLKVYILAIIFSVTACTVPIHALGGEVQVRAFVSNAANLANVRSAIVAAGGNVRGFTPERAFVLLIDSQRLPSLGGVAGITALLEVADAHVPLDIPPVPGLGAYEFSLGQGTAVPAGAVGLSAFGQSRALAQATAAADNSLSIYFPPIGNQGAQNSCVAWASCYYFNSYTQAKGEGINITGGTVDPLAIKYIGSPAFLYNLDNSNADNGLPVNLEVDRLNNVGCASFKYMPYSDTDYLSWPSGEAWINALNFRTQGPTKVYDIVKDQDFQSLKNWLANGGIAVTRADLYFNWYTWFDGVDPGGVSNGVLYSHAGYNYVGSHALTFVGYDDNRSYNSGGTIKKGAFLVANSWGTAFGTYNSSGRGTRGFMWVAYEYARNMANRAFNQAYSNDDLAPKYRPLVYTSTGITHPDRGYVKFKAGLGNLPAQSPDIWLSYDVLNPYSGVIPSESVRPINAGQPVAVDISYTTYLDQHISQFLPIEMFDLMGNYSTSAVGRIESGAFCHKNDSHDLSLLPNTNYTCFQSSGMPVNCPIYSPCNVQSSIPPSYYVSMVGVVGPTVATKQGTYTFSAQASPLTVGTPIDYTWTVTGYPAPIVHHQAGTNADTLTLSWDSVGTKTVMVTAQNSYNSVQASATVSVQTLAFSDIGFVTCPDGVDGLQVTLSGTSANSSYEFYFRSHMLNNGWMVAESGVPGQNGSLTWTDCRVAGYRSNPTGYYDAALFEDADNDGLGGVYEVRVSHTDPNNRDSDNDGISDGDEDPDGDLVSNAAEYNQPGSSHYSVCRIGSSDPNKSDTDNDGHSDWEDHFPVDPAAWFDPDCDGKPSQAMTVASISHPLLVSDNIYNLAVSKTGYGEGMVTGEGINCGISCAADYYDGKWVKLNFLPASNTMLLGWAGVDCYGRGECAIKMDRAKAVSAIVGLIGDISADGVVNCVDLGMLKSAFGKSQGQTGYNAAADINADGIINVVDLAMQSRQLPASTVCR